jgi:Arm DNA-binding domain
MTVTIREKPLQDNRTSLYLDIYANGRRSYRILKLYIASKPKTQFERDQNKDTRTKAELIRIRTLSALVDNKYQIHDASKSTYAVLDYFKYLSEKKKKSKTYKIWLSAVLILEEYLDGEKKLLRDLAISDIENIKNYFYSVMLKRIRRD